jgi:hypothetical protein
MEQEYATCDGANFCPVKRARHCSLSMQGREKLDDLKQKTGFFESESPQNGPKTGENQPFFCQGN